MVIKMAERPIIITLVGLLYILIGIGIVSMMVIFYTTDLIENFIRSIIVPPELHLGDTVLDLEEGFFLMAVWLGPEFVVFGIISIFGGLELLNLKKRGWRMTIIASIMWALFLIGVLVALILLKEEHRSLFS